MTNAYEVGDTFTLSPEALDNYGQHYQGQVFTVTYWADHEVPVSEFFNQSSPRYHEAHGHVGFDENAGSCLYGSDFPSDLYEWEMAHVIKKRSK